MKRIYFCWGSLFSTISSACANEAAIPAMNKSAAFPSVTTQATAVVASTANQASGTLGEVGHMIVMYCVKYSFQVLGGILVLLVGWFMAQYAARAVQTAVERKNVDVTVSKFMAGAVRLLIMALACVVALSKFGIEIAPFIAGISVVGFGTSFALQGPLSNYASGATLIFTKPFKVGDIIEVAGVIGEVIDMQLGRTDIKTVDGEIVVIPNKHIIGEIVHNYSSAKRVDVSIVVAYGSDTARLVARIEELLSHDPLAACSKPPRVGISEFTDLGIKLYARFWCPQEKYWDVRFYVNQRIVEILREEGVEIPTIQKNMKEA